MFNKNWTWALLGSLSLLLRWVASWVPETTESIYSRSAFPYIRQGLDMTIARFPFPTFYLFLAALFLVLALFISCLTKQKGWKRKSIYSIRSLSNLIGVIVVFFLFLWGFNYQRVPIIQQLSLQPIPLSQEQLNLEIQHTQNILVTIRSQITQDTAAIEETIPYAELENLVRKEIIAGLPRMGLNNEGQPRTKEFFPSGFLRKMGILGIYFPFTGESYIDPTLHDLEKPFTVAHEMAHSFGITNEGEASFVSWVICTESKNPLLQYAANLQLLRYQLNDLYRTNRDSYLQVFDCMELGVRNDLVSIIKNAEEIKPISQKISRRSNDLFLKSQGVEAGVKSYAQLPMLAFTWRKHHGEK
jgi:hypothetical protein